MSSMVRTARTALRDVDDHPAGPIPFGDRTGPSSIPAGFIGAHALQALHDVLDDVGARFEDVFWNASDLRLSRAAEAISFSTFGRLLETAAKRTGCGHFGLLVGQRMTLASLGLLGTLVRHSRTVADALRAIEAHYDLLSRGAMIELSVEGAIATVTYAPYDPDAIGVPHQCERAVGAMTGIMRSLCGSDWCPEEVWLPRLAPVNPSPYTGYFRAPVRFSQEVAALVFPARILKRPVDDADPAVRAAAEQDLRRTAAVTPLGLCDEVRRCVRSRAIRVRVDKGQVAQALALHQRTLCRRLRAEGATFRSITNETRLGIARQLLADTTMSLAEISVVLEFSEPAAFTHAFRRWTGMTPSAWRKERQAGSAG